MEQLLLCKSTLNSQKGVTLIEMAVVVSIIALLLAGTLGGTSLYQASKLRRLSTEIIQYETAIRTFKEEYHYWPGDFNQAETFWTSPSTGVTITNGNGDGDVSWNATSLIEGEDHYAWAHLSEAELINGAYSGQITTASSVQYTVGVNVPRSEAFKDVTFSTFLNHVYVYGSKRGLSIRIAALDGSGLPRSGDTLNAKQAQSIDIKIDDGVADTGKLIGFTDTAGQCIDNKWNAANNGTYLLSSNTTGCILEWYITML